MDTMLDVIEAKLDRYVADVTDSIDIGRRQP